MGESVDLGKRYIYIFALCNSLLCFCFDVKSKNIATGSHIHFLWKIMGKIAQSICNTKKVNTDFSVVKSTLLYYKQC